MVAELMGISCHTRGANVVLSGGSTVLLTETVTLAHHRYDYSTARTDHVS